MMHLNVEKDIRNGLSMMKYSVNHYNNFKNVHQAFFIGFLLALVSISIELTVVLVLVSLPNALEVIMKYVSLCAIANIPRFYYGSLVEHKLLKAGGLELDITNFRKNGLMASAPIHIRAMRVIQKGFRLYFVSFSYYFMPFSFLIFTYFTNEQKKNT